MFLSTPSPHPPAPPPKPIQEVQKRFPDGLPLLDPIDDMGIKDPGLKKVIQKVEAFEHRMYSHPLHSDPSLEAVYTLCEKKALVRICRKPLLFTLLNVQLQFFLFEKEVNRLSTICSLRDTFCCMKFSVNLHLNTTHVWLQPS